MRCLVVSLFACDTDFSVWLSHTSLLCRYNNEAHMKHSTFAEVTQDHY